MNDLKREILERSQYLQIVLDEAQKGNYLEDDNGDAEYSELIKLINRYIETLSEVKKDD